jgi:hypothetical protein
VTLPHELRGRELHRWPGRRSETRRDLGKPGGQRQRGNEKAQAQCGADGFAVGADVNDAPGAIDRGKRWRGSWIPERSATRLREADLNVFSKLGNQGLEGRLEPEAFTGREVRREDDLLDFLVGYPVDIEMARQPST